MGALALGACTPAKETPPPMQRLLPGLGVVTMERLSGQTRPAAVLAPGEVRRCPVQLARGSRLVYAAGILNAPPAGRVRVTVTVGGKQVDELTIDLARRRRWWRRAVELQGAGESEISFRGEWVGNSAHAPAESKDGWSLAIGSPRIYRGGKPGRVLVWISQDALRADHLGLYGYQRPTSPQIQARARDWVVFDKAMSTCSWTLPSMTSQFTGELPSRHGVILHTLQLSESTPTVFQALASDGFTVVGVTANDLISPASGLARGFDVLFYLDARAEELNHRLDVGLSEWGGGDLALFIHYMDPHAPYVPPESFGRRFDARWDEGPLGTSFEMLNRITAPGQVKRVVDLYDAEIAYADHSIGDLLAHLAERGLLDRAVIAYSADHGEEFQDHGRWQHGSTLYQEVLHVPLALRVPGFPGRRIETPVSMLELGPTLLDALNVARPVGMDVQGLMPWIRGEGPPGEPLFAETALTRDHRRLAAVRDGDLKYIAKLAPGDDLHPSVATAHLYDLARDPHEHEDLRAQRRDTARLEQVLLDSLARNRARASSSVPAVLDDSTVDKLRELGYVQ